ncbi:hypothetical protein B0H15DRAFT_804824 [Mycena belliarum]|uniref:Uncharacterized protein n=1 Tax=Mycena belliarum TaxID=1033014 RepID=A0AAD6TTE6_9AGAR|nr:hypothetical protein B0H15DRAFT_804824 [Mycena belliae]
MNENSSTLRAACILLWMLSLLPNNPSVRYAAIGILTVTLIVSSFCVPNPSTTLNQLDIAIDKTEEIIAYAKLNCARDYWELVQGETRLLQRLSTPNVTEDSSKLWQRG